MRRPPGEQKRQEGVQRDESIRKENNAMLETQRNRDSEWSQAQHTATMSASERKKVMKKPVTTARVGGRGGISRGENGLDA